MTPDSLNEFIVFSKYLNVTRAARELNLSPSTLSRHLASLANEVGMPLFERVDTNQLALTQAGAIVLQGACTIVADHRAMMQRVGELKNKKDATIRVAYAIDDRTVIDCISVAKTRLAKSEECSVSVEWVKPQGSDYRHELQTGKADVIVDYDLESTTPDPVLEFVPLVEDSIVLALPKGTFSNRKAIDVNEVCGRFIPHPSSSVDNYLNKVLSLFAQCEQIPSPRFINASTMDDFYMHNLEKDEMWLFSRRQLMNYTSTIPLSYRESCEIHELAGCDTTLRRFAVYRRDNPNPLIPRFVDAMARAL